jgi:putative ABC transport system permease protein
MISIILGVAFLAGSIVLSSTIKGAFDDLFSNVYKKTDVVVRGVEKTRQDDFGGAQERENIPKSVLKDVQGVDGVRVAQGQQGIDNLIVLDKDGKKIFNSQGPPTLGVTISANAELSQWHKIGKNNKSLTIEQTIKTKIKDDEVLIDKATSEAQKLHIGDRVNIVSNQDVRPYTIAGYMRFGTSDGIGGAAIFFFNESQIERIANTHGVYQDIEVAAKPGVSQETLAKRIEKALDEKYPKHIDAISREQTGPFDVITGKELTKESQKDVKSILDALTIGLVGFAAVSFLVAIILIINSFAIIVAQRKREYALLRAVGAKGSQVRRSVFTESLFVGIIASLAGYFAGLGLTVGILALMRKGGIKLPQGPLQIKPNSFIIAMLVGTISTIVAALVPAWQASRVPPVAALRESAFEKKTRWIWRIIPAAIFVALGAIVVIAGLSGPSDSKAKTVGIGLGIFLIALPIVLPFLVRPFTAVVGSRPVGVLLVIFGGRRAFGITGDIARRNNIRNPRRSARTALALSVGVALVVFITVFAASAKTTFTKYLDSNYSADLIVGDFNTPVSTLSPERCQSIREQSYVKAASCIYLARLQYTKKIEPNALRQSSNTESIIALNTQQLSTLFNLKHTGNINNLGTTGVILSKDVAKKDGVKIGDAVGIQGDLGFQQLIVRGITDEGLLGPGGESIVVDSKAYQKVQTQRNAYVSMVVLQNGESNVSAKHDLEGLLKNTGIDVNDLKTVRDQQISQLNGILTFIYGLLALSIIIASIGILNTMSLSILERRRELGLMRAVGTTKKQVRGFVRFESIIISVLGTTVGMLFGIGSSYLFLEALKDKGFVDFSLAPGTLIVILILSAIIGVVAGAWPAWRATKVDVLKAVTVE